MSVIERPPVRYDIGQEDYDHTVGMRLRVFCDGVEMEQVVAYDCEAGTVLKNKLDADGYPQVNANRDAIERETVHGEVTVEWRDQ